jgi:uncharacterized protein YdiU (UPF0061 family)
MPPSPAYRPDPLFEKLGAEFADPVTPASFPDLKLRWRNQAAAARVGLDTLTDDEWRAALGRFEPLPGNMQRPLAMRYHGHQFRVYNPDIGDGRGFLYAQLRDAGGRLLDLATKGSGQTPYSRFGDGRLTLKGGVREVLAAEMLWAQGVKTSKAFSLYETGEALERNDEPSPTRAAVLVRLQHSHMRFGTFQRHAAEQSADRITQLVDHAGEAYFPEILKENSASARAAALFREVVSASANLCAGWMSAGFVHGVLNTDNLVLTGESFDYGPWRFLPANDPGFTAAYFDQQGLYAFGRQPEAVHWNLAQLGGCLAQVSDIPPLQEAMNAFPVHYQQALVTAMLRRLGLEQRGEEDLAFLSIMFKWMNDTAVPWDQFFHDWFCGEASEARAKQSPAAALYDHEGFAVVRAGLATHTPVRPERLSHAYFQKPIPASLEITEVEALWDPIAASDDWSAFHAKIAHIHELKDALDIAVA